ncbi:ribonuclease catalytic domain-containing protein [Candidatus Vallotiella sp. (ex Adelges kitamiensis)]|uniref:ribonuclease catalytic domain-containing protein n=1 Tax=Candidatus Vallotiella sp. (ex Adelges kitamiensis) TaxID=2864217 RepID=UPI001CE36BC0|nr:ribonuclease catalytic domain-containing protein [Candidatus Vallotia sp. (ex Adelges kitamiensis)]
MNVFFEESGGLKVGMVLNQQGDTFLVELPTGRRAKARSKDVLIRFHSPSASDLMQQADVASKEIDLDFLWEISPIDKFCFIDLAHEYFGGAPDPVQQSALVLCIHSAPVYFRRKGRGQYQRAPEEQLKMAIKALERRRHQALIQHQYVDELKAGRLPAAFNGKVLSLLTRADKNSVEYKVLEAAALALGKSAAQLMLDVGGISSARAFHEARFLYEYFPHGTDFPELNSDLLLEGLSEAIGVQAFSIDDVTTTEIDDAFSVQRLSNERARIGIHIAAPALGIESGDAVDMIARSRLSTVYMPGNKITMLPDNFVGVFTLKEGGFRPVVSLYLIIDTSTQDIIMSETVVEQVYVLSNLRHNVLDEIITEQRLQSGTGDYPHKNEIAVLWPFARSLYERRQQARIGYGLRREMTGNLDYNFYIHDEHVRITPRRRGSPLDLIVSELAILANSRWGAFLHEHGVPGIYRAQRAFGPHRTRMQTTPAPHEGLGVVQYAWSTSPLRRYVDLVNQWQLLACVRHGITAKLAAPFKPKDAELYAIVQNFNETYTAYSDHQKCMEHFWCLRWLKQEQRNQVTATIVKDNVVRLEEVPLLLYVPGLGVHARGVRVLIEVMSIDELRVEALCRFIKVLDVPQVTSGAETHKNADDKLDIHSETDIEARVGMIYK